ncbi:hypothetical protein BEP19_08245 [Ammoniphilus oxalaticus]|uniref:HD-GYP domain-containing protein n=2 Tax=Ammoniphilus oxalaticus TaxID=66863 RepID=A0A419SL41_9BACL|nr:hypothetical protein BEP19_08245 [Ammoniphilus oxalaticus]
MSLVLSTPCGTEMIHHFIPKGAQWSLFPEKGRTATEAIYVLSGKLLLEYMEKKTILVKGDGLSSSPLTDDLIFEALEDSEFMYTTTEPIFYTYSNRVKELRELSVAIGLKDGYTDDHCSRIRDISLKVGKQLGLTQSELFVLSFGSFFHDLGKIMIPEQILLKTDPLTEKEREALKLHTVYGGAILRETGQAHLIKAAEIVEQHHERYDGKGYPIGYEKDEINMGAAIVAVVDSYDAMITDRVYQKRRTPMQALEEIKRCRGVNYHPDVVDAFIKVMQKEWNEDGTD